MMERIGDHLTYLAKYAASFQSSEEVQKVHIMYCNIYIVSLLMAYLQALVAAYCDLLDFYVRVRKLFTHKKGTPSCK